jgi:hypothetical protein
LVPTAGRIEPATRGETTTRAAGQPGSGCGINLLPVETMNPPPGIARRDEATTLGSGHEQVRVGRSTSSPCSDGFFLEGIELVAARNVLESVTGSG